MRISELHRPAIWSFAAQRVCTWYPLRRRLASLVAAFRPQHQPTSPATVQARTREELQRDGVSFLPGLVDPAAIERIRGHLEGAALRERFAPHRSGFTLDTVPPNVHVAEYDTAHILRCPDVLGIANRPELLDAAAAYLGCKPTISNMSIWWSLPAADGTAQEAENYHRDVDDWRFLKLFIYLTEVDAGTGPHRFVKGSHRSGNFLRIRRIPDAEVEAAFPQESQLSIGGRPGDAFFEDTFGLHKGQPPTQGRRLLFQIQYSVNPIAVYRYGKTDVQPAVHVDRYINRLYV